MPPEMGAHGRLQRNGRLHSPLANSPVRHETITVRSATVPKMSRAVTQFVGGTRTIPIRDAIIGRTIAAYVILLPDPKSFAATHAELICSGRPESRRTEPRRRKSRTVSNAWEPHAE